MCNSVHSGEGDASGVEEGRGSTHSFDWGRGVARGGPDKFGIKSFVSESGFLPLMKWAPFGFTVQAQMAFLVTYGADRTLRADSSDQPR
jgi:hypothetical protein